MPSGDIMAGFVRGLNSSLIIYDVYNNGNNNDSLSALIAAQSSNGSTLADQPGSGPKRPHLIWLGDFNRHHPAWDDPNNTHLFTNEALLAAKKLIEAVADMGLNLVLLVGIPTHIYNVTKH